MVLLQIVQYMLHQVIGKRTVLCADCDENFLQPLVAKTKQ